MLVAGVAALAGCSDGGGTAPVAVTGSPAPPPSSVSSELPPVAALPPPSSPAPPPPSSVAPAAPGKVVVLDPGHNGGNASHASTINKPVPAGRGQTKPCNTTGTSTDSGYPEHAFTWAVAQQIAASLQARGVRVVFTRDNDTGVGPCVDKRAEAGNQAGAAAVVSIHADGSDSPSAHGFHVSYSNPPLNSAQGQPSVSLADDVRGAMSAAGLATSNYLGTNGIYPRADLAGLNLSTRPAVLVECGNMRNAAEAAAMTTASGRARYADAIAAGIEAYLGP